MLNAARLRSQRGQTSAEYVGLILVIVAIVAAVATSGIGGAIARGIEDAICSVGATGCGAQTRDGGRGGVPRAAGVPAVGDPRAAGDRDGVDAGPGRGSPADRDSDGRSGSNGERQRGSGAAGPAPEGGGPDSGVPASGVQLGADGGQAPKPFDAPAPDPGAGEHASESPGVRDRLSKQKWRAIADGAEVLGLTDAARHLRHYLDNSGKPLNVDVGSILHDEQPLRDAVANQVNRAVAEALQGYDHTGPAEIPFRTSWAVVTADGQNWHKALGSFSHSVTGVVHVEPGSPPRTTVTYRVHVHDRYNWDTGKDTPFGSGDRNVVVDDTELQNLHRKGLAQEYDVDGTSKEITVTIDPNDPGSAAPPAGDGRDGSRADPGRSRG